MAFRPFIWLATRWLVGVSVGDYDPASPPMDTGVQREVDVPRDIPVGIKEQAWMLAYGLAQQAIRVGDWPFLVLDLDQRRRYLQEC